MSHYGNILKEWIKDTGQSQDDFAKKIGMSGSNLSLQLDNQYPRLKNIERICKALHREPWELWVTREEYERRFKIPAEYLEPSVIVYNMPPEIRSNCEFRVTEKAR